MYFLSGYNIEVGVWTFFPGLETVKRNLLKKENLTISTHNHHRCLPFCKLKVNLNKNFIHQEGWLRERIRPGGDWEEHDGRQSHKNISLIPSFEKGQTPLYKHPVII